MELDLPLSCVFLTGICQITYSTSRNCSGQIGYTWLVPRWWSRLTQDPRLEICTANESIAADPQAASGGEQCASWVGSYKAPRRCGVTAGRLRVQPPLCAAALLCCRTARVKKASKSKH